MATISASGVVTPPPPGETGLRGLRGLMGEQGDGELSWHTSRSLLEVEEDAAEEVLRVGARGDGLRVWLVSQDRGHRLRLCRAVGRGEVAEERADVVG